LAAGAGFAGSAGFTGCAAAGATCPALAGARILERKKVGIRPTMPS
jgi:hypothetical protein